MNRKAIIFGIISSGLSMLPVITYAADFDQLQTAKQQNQSQQQQINAPAVKLQNSDVKPSDGDLITFPKEPFRFSAKLKLLLESDWINFGGSGLVKSVTYGKGVAHGKS